ncbi:MAG: hypothetical protein H0V69_13375 [Acidimicrobiia bacterium]|jgi:hypothetical protein|nr:hypothetical protein [Acidimicrobiia bacterium]MDQ3389725.1 hypothetical protein [Actinomycetota bacterium]
MSLPDRFYTPQTAKALLSWRLFAGVAAAIVAVVLSVHWGVALLIGLAVYAGLVALAMPKPAGKVAIDPFAISEPWRRFVTNAQRAGRNVHDTVNRTTDGPLKDRMAQITQRLDAGLAEVWNVARRGDEIDDAVRRLDPTALRSKLNTLELQSGGAPSDDVAAAVRSVQSQLQSADRLKALSSETADKLRLAQTRLDELAARATEVSVGSSDSVEFADDVDELVVEMEGLRLAVEEINEA